MKGKIITILLIVAFIGFLVWANFAIDKENEKLARENEENSTTSEEVSGPSRVIEVTSSNFNEEVINSSVPVLIDFYADWCGPCKILSPIVEEVSSQYEDVKFVKINIDSNQDIANDYMITSIPTLVYIKNGEEQNRVLGAVDKATVEALIEKR